VFAMMREGFEAKTLRSESDYREFLREFFIENDNSALDHWGWMPTVNNPDVEPKVFPCIVGLRWAGNAGVEIMFTFDIHNVSDMTYSLVKCGALLGNKI
jgi:hypothetical protein